MKFLSGYKISVGNPHFVCFVDDLSLEKLEKYGPILENYKYFPDKTNVEFVKIISQNKIQMLVWERGVGRTLSCGTGACASTVASYLYKSTNCELTVDLEGGKLKTIYDKEKNKITLVGNSEFVFKGQINI